MILISISVISCKDDSKVEISTEEYNKLKGVEKQFFTVNDKTYEIYTGSDGHQYYSMDICERGYHAETQYFHYPDCKKCFGNDSLKNH